MAEAGGAVSVLALDHSTPHGGERVALGSKQNHPSFYLCSLVHLGVSQPAIWARFMVSHDLRFLARWAHLRYVRR